MDATFTHGMDVDMMSEHMRDEKHKKFVVSNNSAVAVAASSTSSH